MKFTKATREYEAWVRKHAILFKEDLDLKHRRMKESPFTLMRATFYRWAQVWPTLCREAARAPEILAVGDLHAENFGTWRDTEGRLIWGINDFDEAYAMAYTADLVRLMASVHLASRENHLVIKSEDACETILEGYREGHALGGRPFVLEENHGWLRDIATGELRDPVRFWEKMKKWAPVRDEVPNSARKALQSLLPERGIPCRFVHRIAGLGSLGRERIVALADWRGGMVAREAKRLLPSACVWAAGAKGSLRILYEDILHQSIRVLDPLVHLHGSWILRRLSPHCSRIELDTLPKKRDEMRLLHAMGFETANVHLGTKGAIKAVQHDLQKRTAAWFHAATKEMTQQLIQDWKDWKEA
jgi:uncharacterized protein (DUF2252 family)